MTDDIHCKDLARDRKLGEFWEREFCKLMAARGKMFTPMQIGRTGSAQGYYQSGKKWHHLTLPDVTVWTAPGEHHEIKHKNPTPFGMFGLEEYRFEALLAFAAETKQAVMYTIHDHGGRPLDVVSRACDWLTANVLDLNVIKKHSSIGPSWVGGEKRFVPIFYWHKKHWKQLVEPIVKQRSLIDEFWNEYDSGEKK